MGDSAGSPTIIVSAESWLDLEPPGMGISVKFCLGVQIILDDPRTN